MIKLRRPRFFYGWYVVAAACASLFIQAETGGFTYSIFLPVMNAEMGWPRSTIVMAQSIAAITAALAGPWLGRIVDRRGPRGMMIASVAGMGLALSLAGLTNEPWQFYLFCGLASGVARSALQSVIPGSMIANWFVRGRSKAYGIAAMGPPIANLLLPPLVTALVTGMSWRAGWIGLGMVALLVGLPPAFLFARRIEETGHRPDGDPPGDSDSATAAASARRTAAAVDVADDWTAHEAIRSRGFWRVAMGMSLVLLAPNTSIVFLFSYLSSRGMETHAAAAAVSLVSALQVISRLVFWGPAISRIGSVRWVLVLWGSLLFGSSVTFALAEGEFFGWVAAAVLGWAIGGNLVLQLQIWPEYFGRKNIGAIIGTSQMVQGVMQAVVPLGLASLLDMTHSYTLLYGALSVLVFIGLVLLGARGRPRHQVKAAVPA